MTNPYDVYEKSTYRKVSQMRGWDSGGDFAVSFGCESCFSSETQSFCVAQSKSVPNMVVIMRIFRKKWLRSSIGRSQGVRIPASLSEWGGEPVYLNSQLSMALMQAHMWFVWSDVGESSDFSTGWLLFASRFPVKVNRISGHESLFTDYQLDMWGYFLWINISSDNSYLLLAVYCQTHLKRVLQGVTVGYKELDVVWKCPSVHLMAFLWRLFNYFNMLTCCTYMAEEGGEVILDTLYAEQNGLLE